MSDKVKRKVRNWMEAAIMVVIGIILFHFIVQPILMNIDPVFGGNGSSLDQQGRFPNSPAQFALYLTIISIPSICALLYVTVGLSYEAFSLSKGEDISFFTALYLFVIAFIEITTPDWLY